MQSNSMPPASLSRSSSSSSRDIPVAGPYLLHGLPRQIMEKRQRSAPRPRSPLRSQICVDEEEELREVDNKQLEDSEVLAVSVPPVDVSQVPTTAVNAAARNFDPFSAYDPECFEDLGLEDVKLSFDIRRIVDDDEGKETDTTMATAGGAVESAVCLSSSAIAAPVLSSPVSSAWPVAVSEHGRAHSEALQRPPLTRTDDAHVSESDVATTTTSALPLPSSTSAPVGLGLLELASGVNTGTDADVAVGPGNNDNNNSVPLGDVVGAEDEPVQTMQLMTLESSSSISRLAAPMVPPSLSVSGPSASAASGGRGRTAEGPSSSGSGMMPPSLSSAASGAPHANHGNLSTSSGSLKEPPVQEMCAPTAVMPGPSPTLVRSAPRIPSPEAVEDIVVDILQPSETIAVEHMDEAAEPEVGDEAGYIGNRMLKSSAAIEKWRNACVDPDRNADSDSFISSGESDSDSGHPVVERRDDIAHADYRDEPVDRWDAFSLQIPHADSVSDSITIATVATESSFDIVESSSSSALKMKKSVEGLGLGLPSEIPGVVVTRGASLVAPNLRPEENPIMMSTAPGCMNLAALARGDVDLDPSNSNDVDSPVMMTSEVREGTQFFTRAPIYGKRLLWRVEEEDQEDLALFEFDEEEELKKLDETVRKMKAQRDIGQSSYIPIPRLALAVGVGAGARALSGAWSRISSLVLSSTTGTSQYDADVEDGGDVRGGAHAITTTTANSLSRSSSASDAVSHQSSSEEQALLVTADARPALDDIPLSPASASMQRPSPRKGYMSSLMSRISGSSSSTASSSPVSAMPTSPTGRKSPGFVEHVDAPRGLGLGRLGAAAMKRFQMLF